MKQPASGHAPAITPYERLGGRAVIARMVVRFYTAMDEDPAFAELRAMHAPDLSPMVESLTDFLVAWTGGPRDWFVKRPGTCVMSLHGAMPALNAHTADQWIAAMTRAATETILHDPDLRTALLEALWRMAHGMAARAARDA